MENHDFGREELEGYLKEVCRYFSKLAKHSGASAEIILVGGASILLNYNFREKTNDTDAFFGDFHEIKDAIKKVSEEHSLPDNWMNSDFTKTDSFSPQIRLHSSYYKKYYGVEIRTVKDEYLIAMKLRSSRSYKHDQSDILGILMSNETITLESVQRAVTELYGNTNTVDKEVWNAFSNCLEYEDKQALYHEITEEEKENATALSEANTEYPDRISEDNSRDFIHHFRKLLQERDD